MVHENVTRDGHRFSKVMQVGIAPDLNLDEVLPRFTREAIEAYANTENQKDNPFFLYLAYPHRTPHGYPPSNIQVRGKAGLYGDFTTMVDAMVGRVLNALEESGFSTDTLVIATG